MFLINTRLDIHYIISLVSRFMVDPSELQRIMRYVNGTLDYGIHYHKNYDVKLAGFSDSDCGSNIDGRKSTSRNYFSLGFGLIIAVLKSKPW